MEKKTFKIILDYSFYPEECHIITDDLQVVDFTPPEIVFAFVNAKDSHSALDHFFRCDPDYNGHHVKAVELVASALISVE